MWSTLNKTTMRKKSNGVKEIGIKATSEYKRLKSVEMQTPNLERLPRPHRSGNGHAKLGLNLKLVDEWTDMVGLFLNQLQSFYLRALFELLDSLDKVSTSSNEMNSIDTETNSSWNNWL